MIVVRHLKIWVLLVVSLASACTREVSPPRGLSGLDCRDGVLLSTKRVLSDANRFIAHAGGAIGGHLYTNSRDAFELAIDNGYRFIELDFIMTSDGHLVAAHDWGHWRKITGSAVQRPTLEQFLATPIHGLYSAISFRQVAEAMAHNPRLVLVTDKTNHFDYLAANFPDPDRLLVEVFSEADLVRARAAGLKHLMPSTLWEKDNFDSLIQTHGVRFLASATRGLSARADLIKRNRARGVCTFAFSSNERTFVEEHLTQHLFGIYTDYYVPRESDFLCAEKCKTY